MIKWLFSLLGFLLLATAISALTLNVFISAINSGYDNANAYAKEKTNTYVDETYNSFLSKMDPAIMEQISSFEKMTADIKKTALTAYCVDETKKDEAFCNPRYISGELNFEAVMKESIKTQVESTITTALTDFKNQLSQFTQIPLIPVTIITVILSLFFYLLSKGFFAGLQRFFSSAVWISVLSAFSFKAMGKFFDKIIGSTLLTAAQAQGVEAEKLAVLMNDVLMRWLTGAMNQTFVVCLWLAGASFVLWFGIKMYRKYNYHYDA